MRITIDIKPTEQGWALTYTTDDAALALAARTLGRCGPAGTGYPVPPAGDAAAWKGKEHAVLCEANDSAPLELMFDQLIVGQADEPAMRQFGSYLSAVLFGPHLAALCAHPGKDALEIRLAIAGDAGTMLRLPWELIYGPDRPLAADDKHKFSIVRVVARESTPETNALELPLRVLFVVGQAIDDSIRPGAEYMALLRRLATTDQAVNFNSRLLLLATPEEIEATVDSFAPSVVHFICHGDFDGKNATILLTAEENGVKTGPSKRLTAVELLDLLHGKSGKAKLPSVIVLNSCHTAEVGEKADRRNAYGSFAATLVTHGVPVAVGMAGEVADGACRLFTTGFYEALISGNGVELASGTGRRAALRRYKGYTETIEWARPVLYIGGDVAGLRPVPGEGAARSRAARQFLTIPNPGAFCDRLSCIDEYEKLLLQTTSGTGSRFVLGFAVKDSVEKVGDYKPQYGKSRLIEELAARLTLDGIAPILDPASERLNDRPITLYDFAQRVGDLANATRERFKVKARRCTAALAFAIEYFGIAWDGNDDTLTIVRTRVNEALAQRNAPLPIDHTGLKDLLARDARELVADLAPMGIRRAALVIDDLHLYDGIVQTLLKATGEYGLGEMPEIVPLIFTYIRVDPNGIDIFEFMSGRRYQDVVLGRFSEEVMAHRQFLLTRLIEPLAFSGLRAKQEDLLVIDQELCDAASGLPSGWGSKEFVKVINLSRKLKILIEANDEDIMRNYG